MTRDLEIRLGRASVVLPIAQRTVVLCDDATGARAVVDACVSAGVRGIRGDEGSRSTVQELLPRRTDETVVDRMRAGLRLDADILQWRPRDIGPLQRLIASSFVALVSGAESLVFDLSAVADSAFDAAHACAHLRRIGEGIGVPVIAVIADAALLSSAGSHLVVVSGDTVVEAGPLDARLAAPDSDQLRRRLEATPVPNPMAMQMRRVQRVATRPVNYAHTTIIELPTRDSVALAGGEEH